MQPVCTQYAMHNCRLVFCIAAVATADSVAAAAAAGGGGAVNTAALQRRHLNVCRQFAVARATLPPTTSHGDSTTNSRRKTSTAAAAAGPAATCELKGQNRPILASGSQRRRISESL